MQQNFLKLAKNEPQRFVIIDAGRELEVVGREVERVIEKFLSK